MRGLKSQVGSFASVLGHWGVVEGLYTGKEQGQIWAGRTTFEPEEGGGLAELLGGARGKLTAPEGMGGGVCWA